MDNGSVARHKGQRARNGCYPEFEVSMRGLLIFLCLFGWSFTARAACIVTPLAVVPLTPAGGVLVLPVMVNGIAARFLLDTGAERSVVTRAAVQRLDLALDEWVATTMRGVGGVERNRNADPRSISLGGVPLQRHTLARDSSLTVATLPAIESAHPIDGLLGRDFLSRFDLALDMPALTLRLYDVRDCGGNFLPWKVPYVALPVESPMANALVVQVRLDGVALRALLDTGASSSLIAAPGMGRLGLTADPSPRQRASGLGPHSLAVTRESFGMLQVGSETRAAPSLLVAPVHLVPIVDMVLGADWLRGKRVWLSFATRQVFVAQ